MKRILAIALLIYLPVFGQTNRRILFVGDSMTAYTGGWQHQFAKKREAAYTNLSVGGKRTAWMKQVLSDHLRSDPNYTECVIWGGINDAFSYVNLQASVDNVISMVETCKSMGIEPIVVVGYTPSEVMTDVTYLKPELLAFHRERYETFQNMLVLQLAGRCRTVPVCVTITRRDSDDGVHFVASGHRKMADWVDYSLRN